LKPVRRSALAAVAQLVTASARKIQPGVFTDAARHSQLGRLARPTPRFVSLFELADESGTPIFYISGLHTHGLAGTRITFPDGRSLRFPVRGGERHAIMTAVDQDWNRIARYRVTKDHQIAANHWIVTSEIIVHPDVALSDELGLALTVSAPWQSEYFGPRGGG
jgi:hypothetical protein